MTAHTAPVTVDPSTGIARGRRALLPPDWPVLGLFTMLPLWWVLGFGDFIWPLAAFPLGLWFLRRRRLVMPGTIAVYTIFVGWVLLSGTQIDRFTRYGPFTMRLLTYVTAGLLLVWAFNERRVTRERVIDLVSWLWIFAIIGGYLGLLFPRVELGTTLASALLPRSLANNDFLRSSVHPGFAQVQDFLGFAVYRPKTLFAFSNSWGGNVALLTPFFVRAWLMSKSVVKRRWGLALVPFGLVPMVLSVNRGLWLSLTVYAAYVVLRTAPRSGVVALRTAVVVVVGVAVVLVTPLGGIVNARLGGESGDSSRATIYREAYEGAERRPFLGYGGPRPSTRATAPPIGTHGQFWLVMYSQGFVGLALYLAWLLAALALAIRRKDTTSIHLSAVVLMSAVQMLFYNLLPVSLPLIAVALGLCLRGPDPVGAVAPAASQRTRPRSRRPW